MRRRWRFGGSFHRCEFSQGGVSSASGASIRLLAVAGFVRLFVRVWCLARGGYPLGNPGKVSLGAFIALRKVAIPPLLSLVSSSFCLSRASTQLDCLSPHVLAA